MIITKIERDRTCGTRRGVRTDAASAGRGVGLRDGLRSDGKRCDAMRWLLHRRTAMFNADHDAKK